MMNYQKDIILNKDIGKRHNLEETKIAFNDLENDIKKQYLMNQTDISLSFINKKTEKLVTALYMVTDFIQKDEPIRVNLRNLGVKIILDTVCIEDNFLDKVFSQTPKILGSILEINSLIKIANTIGLISNMNSSILIKEFTNLENYLIEKTQNRSLINFQFLDDQKDTEKISIKDTNIDKGHTETIKDMKVLDLIKKSNNVNNSNNLNFKSKPKSDIATKINRRNNILRIIKDSKEVTIKDIENMITDCSQKTIQRELLSLINEGAIKQEGKKRWSRYSLR